MTQIEIQRKANGYRSPATFMEGVEFGLKIAGKMPNDNTAIEYGKLQNKYELLQVKLQESKEQYNNALAMLKIANETITFLSGNKEKVLGKEAKTFSISDVVKAVCVCAEITETMIMERTRSHLISKPRQIVFYICLEYIAGINTVDVAKYFNLDHTSVIHGRKAIKHDYGRNDTVRHILDNALKILLHNDSPVAN